MTTYYCDFAPGHPLHGPYHELEYGFPVEDEQVLFERLMLEINQAGLSWELMLKKRATLVAGYDGFEVDRVAAYGEEERQRLLSDPGVIRNRLKVGAAIDNAQTVQRLRNEYGSLADWLRAHHPLDLPGWRKLFKNSFRFTGGEIVNEFLMSVGYLPGAHREDCVVYATIEELGPPWMENPDFY